MRCGRRSYRRRSAGRLLGTSIPAAVADSSVCPTAATCWSVNTTRGVARCKTVSLSLGQTSSIRSAGVSIREAGRILLCS